MNNIKKIGLIMAGIGMLAFGFTKNVSAAVTDDVYVTVTVDIVSVSVDTTTWAIGQITPSSINISSDITVTNDGNRQEDYSLNLAYTGGWTPSADDSAGADEFAMMAVFTTESMGTLEDADFATTDVVVTGLTGASATVFAIDADAIGVKGYDVAALATRTMHLNFRAANIKTTVALETNSVSDRYGGSRISVSTR